MPWQLLESEAEGRGLPLSQVLKLWGTALITFLAQFREGILLVESVSIPLQTMMDEVHEQVELLRLSLAVLHIGALSRGRLSPLVLFKLHSQLCRLRQLCFKCTPDERGILKASNHLWLLRAAQLQLFVSKSSRQAEVRRQRAAASSRAAAHAAAQSPAHSESSDVVVCSTLTSIPRQPPGIYPAPVHLSRTHTSIPLPHICSAHAHLPCVLASIPHPLRQCCTLISILL